MSFIDCLIYHFGVILLTKLFLFLFSGKNHVIPIYGGLTSATRNTLILPYVPHNNFKEYYLKMNEDDIKRYMRALFTALAHIHKHNIIHRDM